LKKQIQVILIVITLSLGASIRLGIMGWLFIIGIISIILFSLIHLVINFKAMNSLSIKGNSNKLILISHLSYLGLYLFQSDFDDSKSYSAIGKFLRLEQDIFIEYSLIWFILSLIIYIVTNSIILSKVNKEIDKNKNTNYIAITIFSTFILTSIFTYVPPSINYNQYQKEYNEKYYPEEINTLLDSIVKKEIKSSISLAKKIIERDSTIRWVNQTFIGYKLNKNEKIKTFKKLDSLSIEIAATKKFNKKSAHNYYFPIKETIINPKTYGVAFFEYENFHKIRYLHYRVDCQLENDSVSITDKKVFKNLQDKTEVDLKELVKNYLYLSEENPIEVIQTVYNQEVEQNINTIEFRVTYKDGSNKNTCINIYTRKLETCGNHVR